MNCESWLDPQKVRKMIVVGSKKMVVYDDIADDKIAIYDKGIDKKAILGQNMDFDQPRGLDDSYFGVAAGRIRHAARADIGHPIAGLELGYTLPDVLDHAGSLVAEDRRQRQRELQRQPGSYPQHRGQRQHQSSLIPGEHSGKTGRRQSAPCFLARL